jgi:hypothetical protein
MFEDWPQVFSVKDVLAYSHLPSQEKNINPNLEKSTIKLEKGLESALILEKGLPEKIHLNAVYTRIAVHTILWVERVLFLRHYCGSVDDWFP